MGFWLVVYQPQNGCPEEGTSSSPTRIAIIDANSEEVALERAVDKLYPKPDYFLSEKELAHRRERISWGVTVVPCGRLFEFVEVDSSFR